MIKPRVDKLLDHTDSHYAAVVVAAKRARQINSYYHSLGEGSFGEYPPPMVDIPGDRNYLLAGHGQLYANLGSGHSRAWQLQRDSAP